MEESEFWFFIAVNTAESHSTQPVDLLVACMAAMTSFLYKRSLNFVHSSIVILESHLEVFCDVGQFVRPIRTTGRVCIIQPDVIDVETLRDIIFDPETELNASPHSESSAHILFLDSATTEMIFSHSNSLTGSLSVILFSLSVQASVSDLAFLWC